MDLDLLKTFLTVSKTQHFGRAADSLFITQSAVSARIRLLEGQLGHALFQRTKKSVTLTKEGHIFIECANNILEQWQQAKDSLKQVNFSPAPLNISSPALIWQTGLDRIAAKLPQTGKLLYYNPTQAFQITEQESCLLLIAEQGNLVGYHQQALTDIVLMPVCAQPFRLEEKLQYIHLPWSNKFNRFAETQAFLQPSSPQTDQLSIALHLLSNTPSFTYLPVTHQVQSERFALIELDKKPSFNLSLVAYFSATSHLEANYQAAFSYIQQELNACQNQ